MKSLFSRSRIPIVLAWALLWCPQLRAGELPATGDAVEFQRDVAPLLQRYCVGCHNGKDYEGDLSMDTFASFLEGGESGNPIVVAGDLDKSFLIRVVTGAEKPRMPPRKEPQPGEDEIKVLKQWVAEGAKPPADRDAAINRLVIPSIPAAAGLGPITAGGLSSDGTVAALARFGVIELIDGFPIGGTGPFKPGTVLGDLPGKVNALHFSIDGNRLVAATGVTGVKGVARVWNRGEFERDFSSGHRDILYDAEFSPDGTLLATAGYDGRILLWDVETGDFVREVGTHNGAVFDLAFSPDGAVVASASADQTVKLWRVADGVRLDTLNQPEGEQFCVCFSPDGARIFAAGADKRIRMYAFVSRTEPAINPVLDSRFAHDGGIVAMDVSRDGRVLVSAGDDRSLCVWALPELKLVERLPEQPDVVTSLALTSIPEDGGSEGAVPLTVMITRMDGSHSSVRLNALAKPKPVSTAAVSGPAHRETPAEPAELAQAEEVEPNNELDQAQWLGGPVTVSGSIAAPGDLDLFALEIEKGARWVFEVDAARNGSLLDSKIEILDESGAPVEQARLQAVRDSWFTFRGKDSTTSDDFRLHNWEEMELNEYFFAGGEAVKLWHYPRGPDSGFIVYPGFGSRFTYFGTTPSTHALNAPGYIVRAFPPGTELVPNGLPVFTVFYENDDDSKRRFGSDSWLLFEAPERGRYTARVSDVRSFGGPDSHYKFTARPAVPDFKVSLAGGGNPAVGAGSGRELLFRAERIDGFDGEISIEVTGLPPGFAVTSPIVIEDGQEQAIGLIRAAPDAPEPSDANKSTSRVTAGAVIAGTRVVREAGSLGEIKLGPPPKVTVTIVGDDAEGRPLGELVVAQGETVTARVKAGRNGFDGGVPFGNSDAGRNLPHGVYVDNIGLNGLLIVEGQDERQFFVTASPVAATGERWFHLRASVDGDQTSQPVLLKVIPKPGIPRE